ncbi:MAG: hypothetical protein LH618_13020, partial [Saprospiraceae bacterium]|nr:hypothetical protein [Saprospiraceae bacterium]
GYYDHAEREFRGFGRVEQRDTEDFEHWAKGNASNVVDAELHQAPMRSKNWFHTGAYLRNKKILGQFEHEYWYEERARAGYPVASHPEIPLPDARIMAAEYFPANFLSTISAEERQQAYRACKSMALRTEVFADDAPVGSATPAQIEKALTPYSAATHNCMVEMLQPKGQNRHAVFVVKESEAITYNYERDPADPRIAHNLNLQLDQFGNVLESAAVVYPRQMPDASLPQETRDAQAKTVVIFSENKFTNDVDSHDHYRLRLPSEVKTWELKGVAKTGGAFYKPADFEGILTHPTTDEAFYHEIDKALVGSNAQKRLIEHVRSIFYKNDLTGALPLDKLESLGLPFENYQLAYT